MENLVNLIQIIVCRFIRIIPVRSLQPLFTGWKASKYGAFSGPYLPVFRPEKTPYLDTFHAVFHWRIMIGQKERVRSHLLNVIGKLSRWENLKRINIFSKYFSIFNDTPPASWFANIARDFFLHLNLVRIMISWFDLTKRFIINAFCDRVCNESDKLLNYKVMVKQ